MITFMQTIFYVEISTNCEYENSSKYTVHCTLYTESQRITRSDPSSVNKSGEANSWQVSEGKR